MHKNGSIAMTSVRGIGPLPRLMERDSGSLATAQLFSYVGLPLDITREAERMVPLNELILLYEAAARVTSDPIFGLKVGQAMIDGYGTWVDYSRNAPTLHECLKRASRSIAYHQTGTELSLSTNGWLARYSFKVKTGGSSTNRLQYFLHTLPALLRTFRVYAGQSWTPDWIELSVPDSPRIKLVEKALSIPIRCHQPAMAVVFPKSLLDQSSSAPAFDPKMVAWQDLKLMARGRPPKTFSDLVRETIHLQLLAGSPQIEDVAQRLGMGSRTVQRRLMDESRTFRELFADVRLERARILLEQTDLPVTEIAFCVGYGGPTHLARAFTQRLGLPPSAYRKAFRRRVRLSGSDA